MTIKERCKDYILENFEGWEDRGIMGMCADAYEQGAKDQYKIDIDNTCEYFLPLFKRIGCSPDGAEEILRKFRKAMEDKQ